MYRIPPPSTTCSLLVTLIFCGNCLSKLSNSEAVYNELSDPAAPLSVQNWIAVPPGWLKIQSVSQTSDTLLKQLDPGEREAIILAEELNADLLLLDDMKARRIATEKGLAITGILGILDRAATMKIMDLSAAVRSLQKTSFWTSESLLQKLLDKQET